MKYVLVIVVAVLLLGSGGYFLFGMNNIKTETGNESNREVPSVTNESSPDSQATTSGEDVKEFTVEGSPYKFEPNTITVNKGDTVKINFKNVAGMHDFVIDELNVKTEVINSGDTTSVTFVADTAGSFEYYCSVMDHRQKGMIGTLVVR